MLGGGRDQQTVDEGAGSETPAHSLECSEMGNESRAVLHSDLPQFFVSKDVDAEIPRFSAILVQYFVMDDFQVVRSEKRFVVIHGLQFCQHAFFDGSDIFSDLGGRKVRFLEPIDDRDRPSRFQKPGSGGEKLFAPVEMRNRLDAPEKIELAFEVHRFSVHQKEFHGQPLSRRRLVGHFNLNRGNGYPRGLRVIGSGQMKAAGADAASDIKNIRCRSNIGKLSEMLDELKLGSFF
jgi:hypothetical protein